MHFILAQTFIAAIALCLGVVTVPAIIRSNISSAVIVENLKV